MVGSMLSKQHEQWKRDFFDHVDWGLVQNLYCFTCCGTAIYQKQSS